MDPAAEAALRRVADEAGAALKQHPEFRSYTFALDRGAGRWVATTEWAAPPPERRRDRRDLGARLRAAGATVETEGTYAVVAEAALPRSVG